MVETDLVTGTGMEMVTETVTETVMGMGMGMVLESVLRRLP